MPLKQASNPHRGLLPMEGPIARRYAGLRRTGTQMELYRRQAETFTEGLPVGAEVLEVAPGPGYLAIEMARAGRVRVVGLDRERDLRRTGHCRGTRVRRGRRVPGRRRC